LVDEMDLSRSTINRAIAELGEAGFVEETSAGITATLAGRLAVDRLDVFQTELGDLVAADAVVDPLPADVSLTTDAIVGAQAVLATDPMPYQPLELVHDELVDADRYQALLPVLDDPRHVRLLYEHVVTEGREANLVVTPPVFETFRKEFPRRMAAMAKAEEFRVSVTADLPPFAVCCVEDGTDRSVAIVVFTDTGTVHGAVLNDTDDAVEWAADSFETAAGAATDRTAALVADTDGGTVTDSLGVGLASRGQSLSVPLERDGFIRLDTTYFGNKPIADPETAWRAGLSLVEVHTGYAVKRTHDADDVGAKTGPAESVTERLMSTLADGTDCVVVGPPGAGKSTLCKRVACAWY
jgi:predicted transcriptional regulator